MLGSCTGQGQPMRVDPDKGSSESGLARPGRQWCFWGCKQAGVGPAGHWDQAEGCAGGQATGARAGGQTRRHPASAKGKSQSGPRHSRPWKLGGQRKPRGDGPRAVSWGVRPPSRELHPRDPLARSPQGVGEQTPSSCPWCLHTEDTAKETLSLCPGIGDFNAMNRGLHSEDTPLAHAPLAPFLPRAHCHRPFPKSVATRGIRRRSARAAPTLSVPHLSTSRRDGAHFFLFPPVMPLIPAASCGALWFFKLNMSFQKSGESSWPLVPP